METGYKYKSIDLFAGAGGMSQGFKTKGFKVLFANDFEKQAVETYMFNHRDTLCSSDPIESVSPKSLINLLGLKPGQLDVLIGGPPCQGFSTYGQRDPEDKRNRLYLYYLDFLDIFRPKTFVIENVQGILSMEGGAIIDDILSRARAFGYGINVFTLDAVNFGVPQYRRRVFILGGADNSLVQSPTQTHCITANHINGSTHIQRKLNFGDSFVVKPATTTKDAISDLPSQALLPRETQHASEYGLPSQCEYQKLLRSNGNSVLHHSSKQMLGIRKLRLSLMRPGEYGCEIRSRILNDGLPKSLIDDMLGGNGIRDSQKCRHQDREKEEKLREILLRGHVNIDDVLKSIDSGGFKNKYRRLKWDEPAHTLVAHMARDCSDFVHPDVDRFISVREAARLQSFPDNYIFPGSQFRQFRQIGNAVPPLLAEAVAKAIRRHLS